MKVLKKLRYHKGNSSMLCMLLTIIIDKVTIVIGCHFSLNKGESIQVKPPKTINVPTSPNSASKFRTML